MNPGSQACPPVIPQFVLTTQTLAMAVVVGVSVIVVLRQFGRLAGRDALDGPDGNPDGAALLPLVLTAGGGDPRDVAVRLFVPDVPLISLDRIPVEPVAIVLALPAVAIAAFVATARDARRFVVGAIVAIVGWFVIVYPNISALPLPTAIANVYQGVLPTYLYAFQFPVNNVAANVAIHLLGPVPLLLGGVDGLPVPRRRLLDVGLAAGPRRTARPRSRTARSRQAGGATGGAGGGSLSP